MLTASLVQSTISAGPALPPTSAQSRRSPSSSPVRTLGPLTEDSNNELILHSRWAAEQQPNDRAVSLDISSRALTRLPVSLIGRLPTLTSLDLSHNFISWVNVGLPQLTGLVSLDLSHNFIASFSPRLQDRSADEADGNGSAPSERLESLHLTGNKLWAVDQLPTSLTELSVAHNAIERLPRHLATLTNLRVLDVSHNQLLTDLGTVQRCVPCVRCCNWQVG
jgi:Leucine-rich repeat (LRR) protein